MLADAATILARLASATGRRLVSYELKDLEPVSDGIIVGYACVFERPDGESEAVALYVDTSPNAPTDEHTVELVDHVSGARLTAWAYPQDPALPSLPAVSYPEATGVVLAKFGIDAYGADLQMESYRPGKRAVLKIDTGQAQYFAKIVRPAMAASVHELHATLGAAGVPVPRSLGFSDAGLVLIERQPGVPAIERIMDIAADERFIAALTSLRVQLARVPVHTAARDSLARRSGWYAERMAEAAPLLASRAAEITTEIARLYDESVVPNPVTIHGDLHLGQVFVDPTEPWRITGLIDIDTAGLGDTADDSGALFGHLVVSAFEHSAASEERSALALDALARTLASRWPDDAGRTASIAGIHLVGHALAVAGRGDDQLQLAIRLLDEAARIIEQSR